MCSVHVYAYMGESVLGQAVRSHRHASAIQGFIPPEDLNVFFISDFDSFCELDIALYERGDVKVRIADDGLETRSTEQMNESRSKPMAHRTSESSAVITDRLFPFIC